MEQPIAPGTAGLVRHVNHSGSARYTPVRVTRTTKARVFAKADHEMARETEFRLDNLRQYGEKSWRADELILDPAAIAKIGEQQEAEKARKALEMRATVAISKLRQLFEGYAVHSRTEAEIRSLEDLHDLLDAGRRADG